MEEIKTWISGVCAVSLMIAILKAILPEGAAGKTFNMTASLVLIIAVIAPVKKIDFAAFDLAVKKSDENLSVKIAEIDKENLRLTDSIIEKEICEYICNKTGIELNDISVVCEEGQIKRVVLKTKNAQVKEVLINECGVSADEIEEQGV